MRKRLIGLALIGVGLCFSVLSMDAQAEALNERARKMCYDMGLPPAECTLMPQGQSKTRSRPTGTQEGTGVTSGSKADTLAEHGRQRCAQQGVPIEACQALPAELRSVQQEQAPVTAPPLQRYTPPKEPVIRQAEQAPRPVREVVRVPEDAYLATMPRAVYPEGSPPTGPTAVYGSAQPRAVYPEGSPTTGPTAAYRSAQPPHTPGFTRAPQAAYRPAPALDPRFASVPVVVAPSGSPPLAEQRVRSTPSRALDLYRPPPRGERWLHWRNAPAVVDQERARPLRPLSRDDGYAGAKAPGVLRETGQRCTRHVRYSAPPSYRYVTCD